LAKIYAFKTLYLPNQMKKYHIFIIVLLVLIADQALKIYVKTTFNLGTSKPMIGNWFQLNFVENPGMAWGWKFGGPWGKIALTAFRLIAVAFGTWYLGSIIKKGYSRGFIFCASLVYAGAIGNLIDSCFYGIIFDKGMMYSKEISDYVGYGGLAKFSKNGYNGFMLGNVVDMLDFPIIKGNFPKWFPIWGGEGFTFFSAVFNIADAAISTGVISLLVFQKRFFKQKDQSNAQQTIETTTLVDDVSQVS
jgi:signal peptidase II